MPISSTPEPAPAAGSQAEKTIPSKSLLDWLRQQADYSLDVPGFGAVSAFGIAVLFPAYLVLFDKEYAKGDQEVWEKSLSTKDIILKSRKKL